MKLREGLLVALGGGLGTLARVGVDQALDDWAYAEHLATLSVNILGAFGLAFVVAHGLPRLSQGVRSGITVGFFGSYTTFSAISMLSISSTWVETISYLVITFVFGLAAAWLGWQSGKKIQRLSGARS